MAAPNITLDERFWAKVNKTETCWLWTRQVNNKGYGRFYYYSKKTRRGSYGMYAHRVSWILANGPIPDGMRVLHKCDTPACVRPDHLFLGSQRDNMQDMLSKGRRGIHLPWTTKLTPDQVRAIRNDPRSLSAIAKDYGITRNGVWPIKARKSWKHVV